MTKRVIDAGGCVMCDVPCMGVSSCPMCVSYEAYCDRCGKLIPDDEGYSYNGNEYCGECAAEFEEV